MKRIDQLDKWLEKHNEKQSMCLYEKYLKIKDWDMNIFDKKISEMLLESGLLKWVENLLSQIEDPIEQRRCEILRNMIIRAKVIYDERVYKFTNNVQDEVIKFKPEIDGQMLDRSTLREILRKEKNREIRKKAYLADNPLGKRIEAKGKELINVRNELSRKVGFEDFPSLSLSLLGLSKESLLQIFEQIKNATENTYRNFIEQCKADHGLQDIMPWDIVYFVDRYSTPPQQYFPKARLITSLQKTLNSFGKKFEDLNIKIKYADIPYGGLCFGIRIPDDIRILINPMDGYNWYETIFHEFGHAIHSASITVRSYLLKTSEGPFSEGMAEIWSGFLLYPEWLEEFAQMPTNEIERLIKSCKIKKIYGLRNLIKQSVFEIRAHENPEQDLNKLWDNLTKEYLLTSCAASCGSEGAIWSSSYFILTYPMYIQNYLLAAMIREQTHAFMRRQFSKVIGDPQVLDFLIDHYYSEGRLVPWTHKIEKATQKPLETDTLIQSLQ
ncbi:MAG TPA: hypothetical protein EYP60_01405 [bacterium (Candidatus Stahlbacteria)]|nr:hypothetical protein [Candidatus Stahlbacteria bacterium]